MIKGRELEQKFPFFMVYSVEILTFADYWIKKTSDIGL